jgi:hypothetical protein
LHNQGIEPMIILTKHSNKQCSKLTLCALALEFRTITKEAGVHSEKARRLNLDLAAKRSTLELVRSGCRELLGGEFRGVGDIVRLVSLIVD